MLVGITGGTGFIGQELVSRHLTEGDEVRVLSRSARCDVDRLKGVQWYEGDLVGEIARLERFVDGIDVLYHCAAEIRDTHKMPAIHVDGTNNLCSAASGKVRHWVQLSSVGVYGRRRGGIVTEDTPLNPVGVYEQTKAESDKLVIRAAGRGSFTYSILRPSNVFGYSMSKQWTYNASNRSLCEFISMIRRGMLFYIGRPGAMRNYIYVDNVVDALLRCGRMPESENRIFNLSDHSTLEYFVNTIADELGVARPRRRVPEFVVRFIVKCCGSMLHLPLTRSRIDALTNRTVYSNEAIESCLGYSHPVSMKEGLRRLVKAYA